MTPDQLRRSMTYDPDPWEPNPPAPQPERVSDWRPFLLWLAAAAIAGATLGWAVPT